MASIAAAIGSGRTKPESAARSPIAFARRKVGRCATCKAWIPTGLNLELEAFKDLNIGGGVLVRGSLSHTGCHFVMTITFYHI